MKEDSEVFDENAESVVIEDDAVVEPIVEPVEEIPVVVAEEPEVPSVPEEPVIEETEPVEPETISDQFVIKIGEQWVKSVIPYVLGDKETAVVLTYRAANDSKLLIRMRRHVVGEIVKL